MLINIRRIFLFVTSFFALAYNSKASRYLMVAICTSALFGMTNSAVAELEDVMMGAAHPEITQSGVPQTETVQVEIAQSGVAQTGTVEVEAAQSGVAQTGTVQVEIAQSGVAQTGAVQAKVTPAVLAPAKAEQAAVAQTGAALDQLLKKKITIVQFDVAKKIHVDDINNIYDGLPTVLSSRLPASGKFLSAYDRHSIPVVAGAAQREAILQIAGDSGAQFLISGMVVDAGISKEGWSLFGGNKRRHIEIELSIYDGHTGAFLLSRRVEEFAKGDVMVGNNKPFGSSIFFETEFGKAINRLIDSAVMEIQYALENAPFSANIIKVEGKRAFLDAGSDSLLKPGDKVVAYVSDARNPIAGLKGSALGDAERAADTITLTQVKPQFSIGELSGDASKLGVKAGNIVRINIADQLDLAAKQLEAQKLAKAQQEAKAEAKRVKAEQTAQAEAAKIKAKKRVKSAKLKPQQKTRTAQVSSAQQQQTKAEANADAAKLKEKQETKTDLCKRLEALRSACKE